MKSPLRWNWTTEAPHLVLLASLFVLAIWAWNRVPDQIPVHFDINGNVDRYGGRFEGLLFVPSLAVGLYVLLRFLPLIDPARANYAGFARAYFVIRFATLVLLAGIQTVLVLPLLGVELDVARLIMGGTGALFLVFSPLMGRLQPNWFVGIRTPWTLSSRHSWERTHRVGGWVFGAIGAVALAGLVLPLAVRFAMLVAIATCGVVGLVIYSYRVWHGDANRVPAIDSIARE